MRLGVHWYLDLESDMSQVPEGARKVSYLKVPTGEDLWESSAPARPETIDDLTDAERASLGFLTSSEIHSLAEANPGGYWYILGEPNKTVHITGTRFAPVFHYYATELKAADENATILSPSVLNWDFTCVGCGGYRAGKDWAKDFVDAYSKEYGEVPPVDIWAIDAYPIDWNNTPNNDPGKRAWYAAKLNLFQHSEIVVEQLVGMRQYLDTLTEYTNTPIWITEMAVHVGYDPRDWTLKTTGDPCNIVLVITNQCLPPSQDKYHWDKMSNYIIEVLDWLDTNAETHGVEKWFFYKTYRDLVNIATDGYMGISLLDDPAIDTAPNCLGETYRSRSLQLAQKLKCDAEGNTVFAE